MGCCSAKEKVPAQRRRLSVGQVDEKAEAGSTDNAAEDQRGLIAALTEADLLEIIATGDGDRKFSIGSNTDDHKVSFANKTIGERGDKLDTATSGLGYTCRKGLKPESPNQDSWAVLQLGKYSIYGVYDGHGQKGHDVSQFVKENMPKLILKDSRFKTDQMRPMLRDLFMKCQGLISSADRMKKLSAQMSGTTATVVIHDHELSKITISHVADSTCVLGSFQENKTAGQKPTLKGEALTRDHKPDLKDERARIEKAGGRVVFDGYANYRVYAKNGRYPGLNMSRCMGDLLGHTDAGCTAEPEVNERTLGPQDHVLLLCSDGVWEFISPQEAVDIVGKFGPEEAMKAADKLAKEAWDRWIQEEGGQVVDDITVLLIYLQAGLAGEAKVQFSSGAQGSGANASSAPGEGDNAP